WWQTETGAIMITPIPFVNPTKPTYATLPFIGVQPALMSEAGEELKGNQVEGRLCIKFPWPSMARTIWRNHKRYKETYFSTYKNMYFTRSEEHTSELQSRENLVCRLLLEKKK